MVDQLEQPKNFDDDVPMWKKVAGAVAVVLGLSVPVGAACILPDNDIQVVVHGPGHDWCADAIGAEGWDEGEVTHHPIKPDGQWPRGCVCYAGCNDSELSDWLADPPDEDPDSPAWVAYSQALDDIRAAALAACLEAAVGYDHTNCVEMTENAVWFRSSGGDNYDCEYTIEDDDTGGGPMCEALVDPVVPNDFITCVAQGNCDIDEGVVQDLVYAPKPFLDEAGYAKIESTGLKLYSVATTDIIYKMGLRTGDIVLSVNGDTLNTLPRVLYALLHNAGATSFNVSVKRSVNTLSYHYDLI